MGSSFLRRTGLACLGLVAVACQSSGGPPFVWVCTPANYDFVNNGVAEIDIFNGSGTTANVAAHFLAKKWSGPKWHQDPSRPCLAA